MPTIRGCEFESDLSPFAFFPHMLAPPTDLDCATPGALAAYLVWLRSLQMQVGWRRCLELQMRSEPRSTILPIY